MENKTNNNENLVGIERYKFTSKNIIGKGGTSIVYKALDLNTEKNVALKQIFFEEEESIINEINLMKNIDSYYSIKLIDDFKEDKSYYIIMELCDDNLDDFIKKNGKLKTEQIQKILIQLNDVLRFMKIKNKIHRNIKPQNILIKYINESEFIIKLTDFGLGKQLNSSFTSDVETDVFKAPEVHTKNFDYKADLFSIGIVLYYLYFGEYPINEIKNNYDNNEIENLINNLIEKDCNKRLDWNNYINHPFIINYFIEHLNLKLLNNDKCDLSEIYLPSKNKYIGQLLKGTNILEGKGIKYYENGNKLYKGDFKEGEYDGKGIKYYENGNKEYEGDLKEDKYDGKGIKYYENGNKEYEGDFKEGEYDGKGILYYENGNKNYEGDFRAGIYVGKGVKYYENGNKEYEGDFKEGKYNGKCLIL